MDSVLALPLLCIFGSSIGSKRYVFNWNRDKFPDPRAFIASYADANVKLIANIKPVLLLDHPMYGRYKIKNDCNMFIFLVYF